MAWIGLLIWSLVALATLALAILPDVFQLAEPDAAIVLDRGAYTRGGSDARAVSFPYAIFARAGDEATTIRFEFQFDLASIPDKDLFVFVASLNQRVSLFLNGRQFFQSGLHSLWFGPLVAGPLLEKLPHSELRTGHNRLAMVIESGMTVIPIYLSKVYVDDLATLAYPYQERTFLVDQLKTMALAAHMIICLGLIVAAFFRPKDPLFTWLGAFNIINLVFLLTALFGWLPKLGNVFLFGGIICPAMGFIIVGFALATVDIKPPRFLVVGAVAVTCALLPALFFPTQSVRLIVSALAAGSFIVSMVLATAIMAWGTFRRGTIDSQWLLPPTFLLTWYGLRDTYVASHLPEYGFNLLSPYARPLFLAFITVVLMRRMGVGLDRLDRANETLNLKLAEREAELAALHANEQAEVTRLVRERTTRLVRDQERQRLTHDLHDGISGHLVSIIALSERTGDRNTEQAAREALSDLRLVIYSLDLGDRELPLALANLRERLIPQLQRLGVELNWSMAGLPEVAGVTPGNALAVLRILQEAITNALKHGPARKIAIRGSRADNGMASIVIENEGRRFVEGHAGHGLANMRRRAQQLHGTATIESCDAGVRVTLLLPTELPDFEDEAAE